MRDSSALRATSERFLFAYDIDTKYITSSLVVFVLYKKTDFLNSQPVIEILLRVAILDNLNPLNLKISLRQFRFVIVVIISNRLQLIHLSINFRLSMNIPLKRRIFLFTLEYFIISCLVQLRDVLLSLNDLYCNLSGGAYICSCCFAHKKRNILYIKIKIS
jgi:hypothetical protein